MKDISKKIEKEIVEAEELVDKALTIAHSEEAIQKLESITVTLKSIEKHFLQTEKESFQVADLLVAHKMKEALTLLPTLEKHQDELDEELIGVLADIQAFTAKSALKAEHDEIEAIKMITVALIASIIFAILVSITICRSITKPLAILQSRLNEISTGDGNLTLRINNPNKDEIGMLSNSFDNNRKDCSFFNNTFKLIQYGFDHNGRDHGSYSKTTR